MKKHFVLTALVLASATFAQAKDLHCQLSNVISDKNHQVIKSEKRELVFEDSATNVYILENVALNKSLSISGAIMEDESLIALIRADSVTNVELPASSKVKDIFVDPATGEITESEFSCKK